MGKYEILDLLDEAEKRFERESNLIRLESGRVVFVGDTHGDIEATEKVIDRYMNSESTVVFLGDYVDRGPASAENLNLLLKLKLERPDNLFLLMGNHEGRRFTKFYPADFWESLDGELYEQYARVLSKLPLVVSTSNGIIALHGALPDVSRLEDIAEIEYGSYQWQQITWGDWRDVKGGRLNDGGLTGRPQFGRDWFEEIMSRINKNVLIRSHQPDIKPVIYDGRCLTVFSSATYRSAMMDRVIAITDLTKEARSVDDLVIETI